MESKFSNSHLWSIEGLFKNIYDVPVYYQPCLWEKYFNE